MSITPASAHSSDDGDDVDIIDGGKKKKIALRYILKSVYSLATSRSPRPANVGSIDVCLIESSDGA